MRTNKNRSHDLNNLSFLSPSSKALSESPHIRSDHAFEIQLEEIRNDFKKYARFILGDSFNFLFFHDVICDRINESIINFKSIDKTRTRTGLYMPPRHGKTLFICDLLFTYLFGRFPDARCLYATYNEDFAADRKQAVEQTLTSEAYALVFPKALIRSNIEDMSSIDKSRRKLIKNTVRTITNAQSMWGVLDFAGRGTRTTGKGYDVIVVDDPYKNYAEAASPNYAESIKKWFEGTVMTRLEPHSGNMMFLIYTRWVHDDITGMLEEYERSNSDAEYVPLKKYLFPAEMNLEKNEYDQRELGELLIPDMAPDYAFARKNVELWNAMYQQQPLDMVYALMRLEWFPRHLSNAGMNRIVIVVDSTYKEKTTTGDRTAVGVFGTKGNRGYLMEFVNKKMDFPEQLATIAHFAKKYPYWAILIETKANGDALLSSMRQKFGRCIGVDPLGKSKKERAQMVLPSLQAGILSLPDESICPNVHEAISQIIHFTGVGNQLDDMIDVMIYYVSYIEQFMVGQNVSITRIEDPVARRYLPQAAEPYRARQVSQRSSIIARAGQQLRQMHGFR